MVSPVYTTITQVDCENNNWNSDDDSENISSASSVSTLIPSPDIDVLAPFEQAFKDKYDINFEDFVKVIKKAYPQLEI